jgi:hypothetical protein
VKVGFETALFFSKTEKGIKSCLIFEKRILFNGFVNFKSVFAVQVQREGAHNPN